MMKTTDNHNFANASKNALCFRSSSSIHI